MAKRAITALFDDYDEAAKAVDKVEAEGVPHADISIVASSAGERRTGHKAGDAPLTAAASASDATTQSDAVETAGAGAAVGGMIGGGAGLLAGLGLIAIPGIGPAVAAGWLVSALTGAGIGAATGGLLGALTGAGLSHADAETYAEGLRRGGTLLTVLADGPVADRVMDILKRSGSIDLDERAQDWRDQGWTGGTTGAAADTADPTIVGGAPATPLNILEENDAATEDEDRPPDDPTAVEHPSRRFPEEIR